MVIKAGTSQLSVIQLKSVGLDQVQLAAGIRTKPDNIPGIRWNFRLKKDHIKHSVLPITFGYSVYLSIRLMICVVCDNIRYNYIYQAQNLFDTNKPT